MNCCSGVVTGQPRTAEEVAIVYMDGEMVGESAEQLGSFA